MIRADDRNNLGLRQSDLPRRALLTGLGQAAGSAPPTQARTICRTCGTLLVLTHREQRWFLRCPKDGGFVNLTPGEHEIPAGYADDCHRRAADTSAPQLTSAERMTYAGAAALKRAYLQACAEAAGAIAR